jgi:hypothetical protein
VLNSGFLVPGNVMTVSQSNIVKWLEASCMRQYRLIIVTLATAVMARNRAAIVVKYVSDIEFCFSVSFAVYSISTESFQSILLQRALIFLNSSPRYIILNSLLPHRVPLPTVATRTSVQRWHYLAGRRTLTSSRNIYQQGCVSLSAILSGHSSLVF